MDVNYFTIPPSSLPRFKGALPFDVFIRLGSDNYTKIFSAGYPIEMDRFNSYVQKGAQSFYILKSSHDAFLNASTNMLAGLRQAKLLYTKDAQQILDEITERTLSDILSRQKFEASAHASLTVVVGSYIDLARTQAAILPSFLKMARQKSEILKHQITASIFATLLAKAYEAKNTEIMYAAGYAALVHDVGLTILNIDHDESSHKLSDEDKKILRLHPIKAAELLNKVPGMNTLVSTAVLQHHEGYDGSGYPQGLKKDAISLAARIVHIAENFATLSLGTRTSMPLPPQMAIHALSQDKSHDPDLLLIFANLLKLA
jgi:HD-GYP domain-containing protein (c-di-GMP phosphodiesterase class II)